MFDRNLSDQRGRLIIPAEEKILNVDDNEFGFMHVLKQDTFLFAKPPTAAQVALAHSPQAKIFHLGTKKHEPYPAVLIESLGEDKEQGIIIEGKLAKDQEVLCRRIPGATNVYEAVTFKWESQTNSNMPESGSEIAITGKGYVLMDDRLVKLNARHGENFQRINTPIFNSNSNSPELINDIKQSIFGDCFLLSAILSILQQPGGDDFIKGMMKQEADGLHVIVRLYDPRNNQPVYIRVENSVYHKGEHSTVNHRTPWVHVLEKAYTALAFKPVTTDQEEKTYEQTHPSFQEMFGRGGRPKAAFAILTGQPSNDIELVDASSPPWSSEILSYAMLLQMQLGFIFKDGKFVADDIKKMDEYLGAHKNDKVGLQNLKAVLEVALLNPTQSLQEIEEAFNRTLAEIADDGENAELKKVFQKTIKSIFDDETLNDIQKREALYNFSKYVYQYMLRLSGELPIMDLLGSLYNVLKFGQYVQELQDENLWEKFGTFCKIDTPLATVQDAYDFVSAFESFPDKKPPAELVNYLRAYIAKEFLVTVVTEPTVPAAAAEPMEPVETFRYKLNGDFATGLYNDETNAVYEDIKTKLENANHPLVAGTKPKFSEGDVSGLRNSHAYAITGVEEKQIDGRGPFLKFVKLRNPWGTTGRRYDWHKRQEAEIRKQPYIFEDRELPEFELELSEFTKYVARYTVGEFTRPLNVSLQPTVEVTDNGSDNENERLIPKNATSRSTGVAGFLKRHWGKMLVGALIASMIVVAGVFTFGAVPLIAAGVVAVASAIGVSASASTAVGVGLGVTIAAGAAIGAAAGGAIGEGIEMHEIKSRKLNLQQSASTSSVSASSDEEVSALSVGVDTAPRENSKGKAREKSDAAGSGKIVSFSPRDSQRRSIFAELTSSEAEAGSSTRPMPPAPPNSPRNGK